MASVILLKNTESEYPTCQLENRRSIRGLDFEQPTRKAGWRATGPATKGGSGTQSRHSAVPTRKGQTKAAAGRGVGSERGQGRGRSGRGCGGAAGAVPSDSDFRRVFTLRRPKHRRKATK